MNKLFATSAKMPLQPWQKLGCQDQDQAFTLQLSLQLDQDIRTLIDVSFGPFLLLSELVGIWMEALHRVKNTKYFGYQQAIGISVHDLKISLEGIAAMPKSPFNPE